MQMAVSMKPTWATAEAAIGHAANSDGPPVRAGHHDRNASGTASIAWDKTHRYGAGGGSTHHGQDDAAGTFHIGHLHYRGIGPEQAQVSIMWGR
jgi:hypothetical protein